MTRIEIAHQIRIAIELISDGYPHGAKAVLSELLNELDGSYVNSSNSQ